MSFFVKISSTKKYNGKNMIKTKKTFNAEVANFSNAEVSLIMDIYRLDFINYSMGSLKIISHNIAIKRSWIFESGALATSKNSIWVKSCKDFPLNRC